jgi:two-component system cell cycle response regulator DivK
MTAKILVVDDVAKNVKLLSDLLQVKGYATVTAESGPQALAQIAAEKPDLVLMDIQLPDIDGIEALRQIRTEPALDATPVLAVSASVMPDEQQQIVASGFDAYVTKPINLKQFLETVQRVLASGRRRP